MTGAKPLMAALDRTMSPRTAKYLAVYLLLAFASFIAGLQHFVLTSVSYTHLTLPTKA